MCKFQIIAFIQDILKSENIEKCSGATLMQVKEHFQLLKKLHLLRFIVYYCDNAVDWSTVYQWVIKFRDCSLGKAVIFGKTRNERPISTIVDKHRKLVHDFTQNDRRITHEPYWNCNERVGFIIEQLRHRQVLTRWVSRRLTDVNWNVASSFCSATVRKDTISFEYCAMAPSLPTRTEKTSKKLVLLSNLLYAIDVAQSNCG